MDLRYSRPLNYENGGKQYFDYDLIKFLLKLY